jgi:hypothetical protein
MTLNLYNKIKWLLLVLALLLSLNVSFGQPTLPQRTVQAFPIQPIDFGIFYDTGSGGTISVDWRGVRTTTGGIVALSGSIARPAIFDVKLCQGRNVIITYNPTTIISNGANSITLQIDDTEKGPNGSSFPVNNNCNFITSLRVGGTLMVPAGAVNGVYSGSFELTFVQE